MPDDGALIVAAGHGARRPMDSRRIEPKGSVVATDARSDLLLQAALEYAGYGWRVLRCHRVSATGACGCHKREACGTPGKHPIDTDWPEVATADAEKIENLFSEWDGNIGVQLGAASGIIDIECDSKEAETLLLKIFNGDVPVTPTWQSGRGRHRLFQWRPDLPSPDKGVFKLGKLEFRTGNNKKGMQSIVPPSRHYSGIKLEWLISPEDCPVAELSQFAFAAVWNATPEDLLNESVGDFGRSPCRDVFERARRYLAKLPPAISGDGGSRPTYRAACVLVLGFNFTIEQAYPLLEEYSARCDPPWSEKELLHKLDDANKEPGERGYMLGREKAPSAVAKVVSVAAASTIDESTPDYDKQVHKEACSLWREQFMLRGARCFDDPDVQANVFKRLWGFNVAFCGSAMDADSVQEKCVKGLEFIRARVIEDEDKAPSLTALGLEYKNGEWWPGQWRVETVNSDPPDVLLYAPFLPPDGVKMKLRAFDKPEGIHDAVLAATRHICLDDKPGFWPSVWKGQKGNKKEGILPTVGLRVKLLKEAKHLEASSDQKTQGMLAELVLERIRAESKKGGLTEPRPDAAVQKMDDGTVLIRFQKLLADLRFTYRDIERGDLSELFKSTRVVRMPWKGSVVGYYHVKDEHRKALEKLTN